MNYKWNKIISWLFLVVFISSCTENEEITQIEQGKKNNVPCTITIDLSKQGESRLALDYVDQVGMKSTWQEGDGFTIWKSGTEDIVYYDFKLISGAGTSVGEFYCETTPPVEDYNYYVRYPSVDGYENTSLSNQKQVGDGNTDHLSDLITMSHLVGHYTDIRFNSSDYVTVFNGNWSIGTNGVNFVKNSIIKINASNLPADIQPVKVELEVSNSGYVTFLETNTSYNGSTCQKTSVTLEGFDKDKDFEVYLSCAIYDLFLPAGCTLRLTVTDVDGETYYSDKYYSSDRKISAGKLYKLNYNSGWKRGNNLNYQSSDFSADGTVHKMTPIQDGNINVVFVGDGFSDRQIADGTYKEVMESGMNAFLSEEPFTSFAGNFNIYYVDAVSTYEGCIESDNEGRTVFETYFGGGTHVGGNDDQALNYTLKVDGLTSENKDSYLTIVMMNSTKHAGTCWMYGPSKTYGYDGQGYAVCYFPIGASYESLKEVLTHEANGHGFGKLADEYNADYASSIKTLAEYNSGRGIGFYSNVDIYADVTQTLWSEFYVEPYITNEGIGSYEGAFTNNTGFYRSTQNSIMNHNVGGFNAPSRQTLYIRINKLIDPTWEYNHEKFLEWDADKMPASPVPLSSESAAARNVEDPFAPIKTEFVPFAPPVIVK